MIPVETFKGTIHIFFSTLVLAAMFIISYRVATKVSFRSGFDGWQTHGDQGDILVPIFPSRQIFQKIKRLAILRNKKQQ